MLGKDEIIKIIEEAVAQSPHNSFHMIGTPEKPMWERPIVGFARGDDPYFAYYKAEIGGFYWLPKEVFKLHFPEESVADEELTVISIGFPQTAETKAAQKKATGLPSDPWLYTRGEWNEMIKKITADMVGKICEGGYEVLSLDLTSELSGQTSKKFGLAANWSHRHTAFIAGLGTFGLSDGLITRKGKAMRFATLIIKGRFEPTARAYEHYGEYCSFYRKGTCGACIVRCPVGAITKEGHDKEKCSAFLDQIKNELGPDFIRDFQYLNAGCGLCQSRVPCQDGIPR